MTGECTMKKTKTAFRLANGRIIIYLNSNLPKFPLGILALAVLLFTSAADSQGLANKQQSNTASGGQAEVFYVDDTENNAYNAARQETDPKKYAAMLFEFHHKYPKSELMRQSDYEDIKVIEDEYNVYYAARQEFDFEKRAAMLIEFAKKYPESLFMADINYEYMCMLSESSQGKKYKLLESLAEKWLKIHPNDRETYAFIAEAAMNLQEYERCGKSLEAIYVLRPSSGLARELYLCYQKTDNQAKQIEWAEKLSRMPEFEDDYMLPFDLVMRYSKDNNLSKAAEYARLTLKAADLAGQSDAKTKEQLREVHRACHHVIASDLMEKRNFAAAISGYKEAIKDERYGEGYYGIGLCLDNQKKIEEANVYYAMAELMGGEIAPKSKARLETLYRALHNNTLIGIDKVYQKAKESLEASVKDDQRLMSDDLNAYKD
jgi:hypothetical protein